MKKFIILLIGIICLCACTTTHTYHNDIKAKAWYDPSVVYVPKGYKVISIGNSYGHRAAYLLLEPMEEDYEPKEKVVFGPNYGAVYQTEIILIETK